MLNFKNVVSILLLVYGVLGISKAFEFLTRIEAKLLNKKDKKLSEELKKDLKEIKELKEELQKMNASK